MDTIQFPGPLPATVTQAAIALIKQIGIVPGWDEYWDRYFLYELRDVDGGVTPSSDRGAVLEDLGYGNAMYWPGPDAPIHALWNVITMPALVLRARQEIVPGFGFILPAAEAERFAAATSFPSGSPSPATSVAVMARLTRSGVRRRTRASTVAIQPGHEGWTGLLATHGH